MDDNNKGPYQNYKSQRFYRPPTGGAEGNHHIQDGGPGHHHHRLTNFELDCLMDLEQNNNVQIGTNHSHSPAQTAAAAGNNNNSLHFLPSSTDAAFSSGLFGSDEGAAGSDLEANPSWDTFENCAQSVAVLFRNPHWQTFQSAAANTTQLYKDGVESRRRAYEQGVNVGRQRLLKELIGYFRSTQSRIFVRRDELIAFLAGRSPPPRHASHHHQTTASPVSRTLGQLRLHGSSPRSTQTPTPYFPRLSSSEPDDPLHMFHEALALQSGNNSPGTNRSSPPRNRGQQQRSPQELGAFLLDELKRNSSRKRSSGSMNLQGSPSSHHKRQRRF